MAAEVYGEAGSMRREDKRRLPPRLKLTLQPDYVVKRDITGYQLYIRQPWGPGTMTTLVAAFTKDTAPGEIEAYAQDHADGDVL